MWALRWQRLRYRHRVAGTALAACWHEPLPVRRQCWHRQRYLVFDAEMSSLDPARGELLSLGWVAIDDGRIALRSARYLLVSAQAGVGQSAAIHQLRDCDLERADSEASALEQFCRAARGRVLVFHHAPLDLAYLDRASRRRFGAPLLLPYLDTLAIERRRRDRLETVPQPGSLTLASCRRRYGLPDYPAHNALVDALATAELLLAIASHRGRVGNAGECRPARLADFY